MNPRTIIEETAWADLENRNGTAYPETPTMLLALMSGDQPAAEAGLFHLSYELIEYPNIYSAAVPAARYVGALVRDASLMRDRSGGDLLVPGRNGARRPLRVELLAWLSHVVDAASDARVREFIDLAGYSPLRHPSSVFRKVRDLRPQLLSDIAAASGTRRATAGPGARTRR